MGMVKGGQPLPFGHSAEAAVDIEGLVVGAYAIALYSKLIEKISCLKITSENYAKKTTLMEQKIMRTRKMPGKAGTSNPTHLRSRGRMDGWMWIRTVTTWK